ncbi:uncharacterized protein ACMZJ9_012897 [Mantella aurantiaca]
MMEQEELSEAILNHALEIICLLTVEDFIVIKGPNDGTRCTYSIRATEVKRNICDTTRSGCPELIFTLLGMGDKTQKMIAELANKIARLLAKKVPAQCEDVAIDFSKKQWKYLGGHGKPYENNQDTCTVEQPAAPVQQSRGKSYPITYLIKEETDEEPRPATDRPTVPVQKSTEKSYPITLCFKEEPEEESRRAADGKSILPSSGFIQESPEEKPPLPTLNVDRPFMEAQTSSSGYSFISSCDIEPGPGEESSDDTIDSVDEEYSQFPSSSDRGQVYSIIDQIKEEPEDSKDSYVTVSVDMISTDGTSTIPSSGFVAGSSEGKPLLVTVDVDRPFMEAQTSSGFSNSSSCDIKPEPDAESSDDTIDSEEEDYSQFPSSSAREQVYNIIDQIKDDTEESRDLYMPESVDMMSTDEDYLPPDDANCKKARKRKSRSEQKCVSCEVCGKVLGCKSSLEKHLRIHTGERPFTCNDCGKTFSCKYHLTTHERSHAGERPYPCNQCSRRFFKHQHLRLHQVVHTGEKPYSCKVCGKGFTRQSSVIKHSGMHAEQKPFVCTDCGKSYCQFASLIVHQRQHSGEKPFICKHCDKSFACKATMLKHEKAHTE